MKLSRPAEGRKEMSASTFPIVFLFAAFALALWTDARWPRLTPPDLRLAILHLVGSIVVAKGVSWTFATPTTANVKLAMIVALVLPALVYVLLACMWIVKVTQQMISGYRDR